MQKLKTLFIITFALISVQLPAHSESNPFAKSLDMTFGSNVQWKYKSDAAIKSAQDSQDSDTYYHLQYDGKALRLDLGKDKAFNPASAKHFEQFAVEDVLLDGDRLPLFQWCLNHQQRHARFLQQGLPVEKNICENQGHDGAFIMQLNQDTLDALAAGKTLTYVIKPFRTTIVVNYTLSDFKDMVTTYASKKSGTATNASATPGQGTAKKCVVAPPAGFESIKSVAYSCNSASDKTSANNRMIAQVAKEREQRKKVEDEKERKQQAEVAAKKKVEADRLLAEHKKKEEAEILAASKRKRDVLNEEITSKMLGVYKDVG